MKNLLILAAGLLILACTDDGRTRQTLESHGFRDIQITGFEPFDCGKHEDFATGFRAKNPHGIYVQGTVCCGWMKGCTVRF
jgi:hypothetical protein